MKRVLVLPFITAGFTINVIPFPGVYGLNRIQRPIIVDISVILAAVAIINALIVVLYSGIL